MVDVDGVVLVCTVLVFLAPAGPYSKRGPNIKEYWEKKTYTIASSFSLLLKTFVRLQLLTCSQIQKMNRIGQFYPPDIIAEPKLFYLDILELAVVFFVHFRTVSL